MPAMCSPMPTRFLSFGAAALTFITVAALGVVSGRVEGQSSTGPDVVDQARKFLVKKNIPFRNVLLNEPSEFWNKKLDFTIPPCYYVFDRHGKWVRFRGVDFDEPEVMYREMDKVLLQMLNEK